MSTKAEIFIVNNISIHIKCFSIIEIISKLMGINTTRLYYQQIHIFFYFKDIIWQLSPLAFSCLHRKQSSTFNKNAFCLLEYFFCICFKSITNVVSYTRCRREKSCFAIPNFYACQGDSHCNITWLRIILELFQIIRTFTDFQSYMPSFQHCHSISTVFLTEFLSFVIICILLYQNLINKLCGQMSTIKRYKKLTLSK